MQINTGDVIGVVGENGNGKTTLLRCIAGQLSLDTGEMHFTQLHQPDYYAIDNDDGPFEIVQKKYHLSHIEDIFSHIVSKKYRWKSELPAFIRLVYYFALGITLLILVFRHSTVRTFFLSLLTGFLLTILTTLVFAFTRYEETAFFGSLTFYSLLFLFGSLSTWLIRTRNVITGITINLFVLIVPLFPLYVVSWYYSWKRSQMYEQGKPGYLENTDLHYFYAEAGGGLLFLILLATYIGKVYRRWQSLPEE